MTSHQKLQLLIDFIVENLNATVKILPWEDIPNPECRWDIPIDGCVYLDEDFPPEIEIYVDDLNKNIDLVITCLIHEMGHILCFDEAGNDHTELDAWEASILDLPQELIPANFEQIKETALYWHDDIEDDLESIEYQTMLDEVRTISERIWVKIGW